MCLDLGEAITAIYEEAAIDYRHCRRLQRL